MQMSLRGLMLFTAVLSLMCVVLFVVPEMWGAGIMAGATQFILPPALLTGLIYSRGAVRAFFLCAILSVALPTSLGAIYASIAAANGGMGEIATFIKFLCAILWAVAIIAGLLGAAIYRYVAPPIAAVDPPPNAVASDVATMEAEENPCDA